MKYGYVRVSVEDQKADLQLAALKMETISIRCEVGFVWPINPQNFSLMSGQIESDANIAAIVKHHGIAYS